MRQVIRIPVRVCLMTAALLVVSPVLTGSPQEPSPEPKKDQPEKGAVPDADEVHRRAAEKVVGGIELEVLSDDKWSKVKLIDKPLLFFGDSTRENDRGSVWGWVEKGRPLALLELYQNVTDRSKWVYAIC